MEFCKEPDASWISTTITNRYNRVDGLSEPNPEWRPFAMRVKKSQAKSAQESGRAAPSPVFRMADSSLQMAFGAINSLYTFLTTDEIVGRNPCNLVGKELRSMKSRDLTITTQKSLSKLQWDFLLETAEMMAEESPKSGERTLFCIVMMFGCYLRVSDLVGNGTWLPTMGSFVRERGSWRYHTIGKGNVQAQIAVKPELIDYLVRYRRSRGLSDYPEFQDETPLLVTTYGRPGLKARQIRDDVQVVFDRTIERMKEQGFPDYEIANLRSATLHWFRHTGATFDAPHRSAKHLQADLRHKSLATTQNVYYNADSDERSFSMSGLGIKRS